MNGSLLHAAASGSCVRHDTLARLLIPAKRIIGNFISNRLHNFLCFGMIKSRDIDSALDMLVAPSMIGDILKLAASYFVHPKELIYGGDLTIWESAHICGEEWRS
jgi:hypothetical protein